MDRKILFTLIVLFVAGATVGIMHWTKSEPEKKKPEKTLPTLEVIRAKPETVRLSVYTQGTVMPLTESTLASRVPGRIIHVFESFKDGAHFRKGDPLVKIESIDYEAALAQAEARLANAALVFEQERARSEQAEKDWLKFGNDTKASALVLRKPQMKSAGAELKSAEAAVRLARSNFESTTVRAPYNGRVIQKLADVGDYLSQPGAAVARIYATDFFEVKLPVSDDDLGYLEPQDLASAFSEAKVPVQLIGSFAGEITSWDAELDRLEAGVDVQTRLTHLIARVKHRANGSMQPLQVGSFVKAKVQGREVNDAFVLPSSALLDRNHVLVVDSDDRLYSREIQILQNKKDRLIVGKGLSADDRIVVTPVEYVVEGMLVNTFDSTETKKDATAIEVIEQ